MAARTLGGRQRPAPEEERIEPPERREPSRYLALAALALTLVPLVTALVHAFGRWTAVGDNALITLRSLDVLTRDHPLLGTWTSASRTVGFDVNNPGPLQFDLLALPSKLVRREGPAIAVVALHLATVVGIFVVARRRGGPLVGAAAMLVTAALCWSMGSEVLVEPWQPHAMLLPFLLFLFLVWSTSAGEHRDLPWLVGVGSLIVQTHVSYAFLIPVLVAWAGVGLALTIRTRRRQGDDGPPADALRRTVVVALVVGALCWSQPAVEQLFGDGQGNLTRLARAATSDATESIGVGRSVRLAGTVIGLPPWWIRPSFGEAWYVVPPEHGLPAQGDEPVDLAPAALSLAAVAAVLVVALVVARRRADLLAGRAVVTSLLLLVLAVITGSQVPVGEFGTPPHHFRFLWPVAAFLTFAVLVVALRALADRRRVAWPLVAAVTGVTAVVAVLAVPQSDQGVSSAQLGSMEVIRDIAPQLSSLEGEGPLLIDDLFASFGDPYGAAILLELRARGVEFVTRDVSLGRQIGARRVAEPGEPRAELHMAAGGSALTTPEGARRVAFHDGLSDEERLELARLQDEVAQLLDGRTELPVTDELEPYLGTGASPELREQLEAGTGFDGEALVRSGSLVRPVLRGMIDLPSPEREVLQRYAELQQRSSADTLALYLLPVD
jgi:hypothetical protein